MTPPGRERCENCGADGRWAPALGRADVVRCRSCDGWTFLGAIPAASELYGAEYFRGGEYADYLAAAAAQGIDFRRKLRLLRRHSRLDLARARLLELGCATGSFLAEAREAGIPEALGVEPSPWARGMATARGLPVLAPDDPALPAAVAALRPNLVVAWDVWEHLPRPTAVLDEVLAAADRGVVLALSTLDAGSLVARLRRARWRQFHPPTHVQYPTRRSLRRWLADRGFAIRHHGAFGYHRPLLEYWRALSGRAPPAQAANRLPWTLPLKLDLWDIQLVIAERDA